ncbi:hypothetical protein NHF40_02600 [Maricaulaceae bacterium EIL42A08]|nr:hypothetical protein [Maricaulaceae bacterium EIL42A08]
MAVLDNGPGAANGAGPGAAENRFLHRAMLALVLIAMVGFAMFSLAGATDITQMPLLTHVHAVTMGAWLILVAVQSQFWAVTDPSRFTDSLDALACCWRLLW